MNFDDPSALGPMIGVAVAAVFIGLRFLRARKVRRLRLEWLWITPVILMAATGALLAQLPPHGWEWLGLFVAFAIGGGLGWYRGRMMTITVDPHTHELNQQASPAALLFLVGLVAVRFALREGLSAEAEAWHLSAAFITDVFVVFAMGLLTVTRLEMFLRARRMLTEVRAAKLD